MRCSIHSGGRPVFDRRAALAVLIAGLAACDDRFDQVTIYDDPVASSTSVEYVCFDGETGNRTTFSLPRLDSARSEACLGISRNRCPSPSVPPGSCEDPEYNVLENTCVGALFSCFTPDGSCTDAGSALTFGNSARVETTEGFAYYAVGDSTPCVVGWTDGEGTFVFLGRD